MKILFRYFGSLSADSPLDRSVYSTVGYVVADSSVERYCLLWLILVRNTYPDLVYTHVVPMEMPTGTGKSTTTEPAFTPYE
jgi:hypothetical protein